MKKIPVILMALGLFGAMPVLAAEHGGKKMDTADGVRECALQAETIQEKITLLDVEVAKGSKKYSADVLVKLEKKLKEANGIPDQLTGTKCDQPGRAKRPASTCPSQLL